MTWDPAGLWASVAVLAFVAGYGLGRRFGRKEGFLEGMRAAPLVLRQASFERGHCPICGDEPPADSPVDAANAQLVKSEHRANDAHTGPEMMLESRGI
ncbi:MAG: hypothetical protein H0Z37_02205 [Firmicutes bacterium]|nr:hypothetical protein [Bacillota bacterium]